MTGAYLDHAASTPMRPEARAAVAEVAERGFANPSGSHRWARQARRLLDDARDVVADVLGARPGEVVFTSGGTESDNLAVTGVAAASGGRPVCSAVEHHAVLAPVLAAGGATVPVDHTGRIDLDALVEVLRATPDASLVSVMSANNEVGTVQPLAAVAELVARHAPGAVLHTDAVAAACWSDLAVEAAPAALVSISGHKVGGPKGIGALVVRTGTPLAPLLRGGGQERERRSGTPNVEGAVGLAAALAADAADRPATVARVEGLRARLVSGLRDAVDDLHVSGPAEPERRLPSVAHLCVAGVDREALLFLLDEGAVGASWGASCASGASEVSHVLAAMGVAADRAAGALRLSLGWSSTEADVDHALAVVPSAVARLRAGSTPGRPSPPPHRRAVPAVPGDAAAAPAGVGRR